MHSYKIRSAQYQPTIVKYQNDEVRYGDRAKISQQVEQMRTTLAAAQFGSRLNLLAATDQRNFAKPMRNHARASVLRAGGYHNLKCASKRSSRSA